MAVPDLGGLPDLGKARMLTPPPEMLVAAEFAAGLRCVGCHARIESGWEYVIFQAQMENGKPVAVSKRFSVCGDCGVEEAIAEHATARTALEVDWLGLDPTAEEPPPAG